MNRIFFFITALFLPLLSHAQDWKAILNEFEQYAQESMQASKTVGSSVAIVKDGKVVYAKGFGERSLQDKQPVTPDTIFQIGSLSKSFTTALTAIAVDRKLLNWEDPVIRWMPTFLMYDPWVTRGYLIEDLYAQRSGLVPYAGDYQASLGVTIDQIVANVRYFQPITSFRSSFAYENVFFSVGAQVLHNTTGKDWQSLIQEEFFQPLGMKSSSYTLASYLKTPNRVGWHELKPNGAVQLLPDTMEGGDAPYIYAASGGINSTILDMAKWIIMQTDQGMYLGKQIVSKENLARTHRPNIYAFNRDNHSLYYCMGWISEEYSPYPIIWHNGGTFGVSTNMAIIPEERLGIVVLCNTRGSVVAESLTMKFFDLYFGKPKTDWTKKMMAIVQDVFKKELAKHPPIAKPLPALPLNAYTGTYSNPVYGDLVVTVKGGELVGEIGPKKTQWIFKHYNRDTFSLWWPPIEDGSNKVLFYMDAENKPSQVFIEALAGENQGLFVKKAETVKS